MVYIAKREGVEILKGTARTTVPQKKLIAQLVKEFPDSKESFEYEDYIAAPTVGSASAFIAMALDTHIHELQDSSGYMKYIAMRPGVELRGDHGLFGVTPTVNLADAISEVESHQGNIWTIIYSLRRSDAVRFGYESAEVWRRLVLKHSAQLAEAMRIQPKHFRWFGAFHNKDGHPHIHLMVWSSDPKEGYLTKKGIAQMRSVLTNDIFDEELHTLYVQKDIAYQQTM